MYTQMESKYKLVFFPHEILNKPTMKVEKFDYELVEVLEYMNKIMTGYWDCC